MPVSVTAWSSASVFPLSPRVLLRGREAYRRYAGTDQDPERAVHVLKDERVRVARDDDAAELRLMSAGDRGVCARRGA